MVSITSEQLANLRAQREVNLTRHYVDRPEDDSSRLSIVSQYSGPNYEIFDKQRYRTFFSGPNERFEYIGREIEIIDKTAKTRI